ADTDTTAISRRTPNDKLVARPPMQLHRQKGVLIASKGPRICANGTLRRLIGRGSPTELTYAVQSQGRCRDPGHKTDGCKRELPRSRSNRRSLSHNRTTRRKA